MARWALISQTVVDRDNSPRLSRLTQEQLDAAFSTFESVDEEGQAALLIAGWYKRTPWDDAELAEKAKVLRSRYPRNPTRGVQRFLQFCQRLGIGDNDASR